MLHHLLESFGGQGGPLGGELRLLLAGLSAFVLALAIGRWFIPFVRRKQALESQAKGDAAKLDQLHAHKSGTPTLGGVIIFGSILGSALLWGRLSDRGLLLLIGYSLALAALGFADDATKLRTKRKGISARAKLRWQVLLSGAIAVWLYLDPVPVRFPSDPAAGPLSIFLPASGGVAPGLGIAFVAIVIFVLVGATNAVNLTDGLDGLAIGSTAVAAAPLAAFAFLCARPEGIGPDVLPRAAGGAEVAVFLSALIGGGLGFLWLNCHPALIFMGDTGALPLGGALGLAAVLCRAELVLFVAGGVLVAEAVSVILQVASFKLTGKRVFLIAPLHHHFQYKGWPETRVTARFWIAGTILAWMALLLSRH